MKPRTAVRSRTSSRVIGAVAVTALALFGATACGDESEPAVSETAPAEPTPAATTTPTKEAKETPADDAVEIDITIDGRDIEPAPSRVKVAEGDKVRLTVTSDVDNEVHVHGVDIYKDLPAGEPTTVTFTADQTGLFEIETHESPVLLLTQLQVQ
jgi:plastocyanin